MMNAGDIAPDFEHTAADGSVVRLADLRGSRVVLFFYPRADTPGCTIEACEIRDHRDEFDAAGAVVLGISPDPVDDVSAFRRKYGLNFRLLADSDHTVAERYGVWKLKSMFGKDYWGVDRTTFVIDEGGVVAEIFAKVNPQGHALELLESLVPERREV
jgi:peroxiredoxin Q/BCP